MVVQKFAKLFAAVRFRLPPLPVQVYIMKESGCSG